MVRALLLDKKCQSPVPVKAVEESYVTCRGAHSYRNCPATDGNNYRDNIQEFVSQASAVNFNQGNIGYRPQMMSNHIRPPGFPPVPNNQNLQRNNQNRFIPNQNQNREITTRSGVSYDGPQIPPPPSFLPPVVENEPEATKDTVNPTNNENTEDVQPQAVHPKPVTFPISEPIITSVENSNLEEHLPPVVTMADNRTMAELLRAPIEGYAEAIVVPLILAEQFELKHSLINLMTTDQFFGLEKDNPHEHIRWGSPSVARKRTPAQSANECCDYRHDGAMTAMLKQFQATLPPALVKAVKEICVTCGANTPVSTSKPNPKASILYPSRRNDERNREKAKDQIEKFYQIFKDMSFEISFVDALIRMPKFSLTLKALIENKEKLSEMARTPLNEHCSAVLLKKLPKKLGDPVDEPPAVELKLLPPHLEYAFLEGDDKLPVIIAKYLSVEEKTALITVLKSHKRAIAWKLSDIKGNQYYCFLNGFSGYFQIPIDPEDQENTTFTCPSGTFAYRRIPFGLCNASRTFQRPMTRLLEKDSPFIFFQEYVDAFQTLKRMLTETPILIAPDWDMPFELMCNASDFAIGAVLGQRRDKHFWLIHYASKTMTEA
nr:hypothetical protein [Tanacetum cinerariifolium]